MKFWLLVGNEVLIVHWWWSFDCLLVMKFWLFIVDEVLIVHWWWSFDCLLVMKFWLFTLVTPFRIEVKYKHNDEALVVFWNSCISPSPCYSSTRSLTTSRVLVQGYWAVLLGFGPCYCPVEIARSIPWFVVGWGLSLNSSFLASGSSTRFSLATFLVTYATEGEGGYVFTCLCLSLCLLFVCTVS